MTEPAAPKPSQIDLNIDYYVKIYKRVLKDTEVIAHEKNWGSDAVFQMTETIFKQFFADQTAVAGQARQTQALVDGMHSVLEARGR
jgi:hypothetical protein